MRVAVMFYKNNDRRVLGTVFLAGQVLVIFGIAVGLIGLAWNFIVLICGLLLCLGGLSIVRRVRRHSAAQVDFGGAGTSSYKANRFTQSILVIDRVFIGFASICFLLLFIGMPKWIEPIWLQYGVIVGFCGCMAGIAISSCYVAWHEYFSRTCTVPKKGHD